MRGKEIGEDGQRDGSGKYAGRAAAALLFVDGMGCRIAAKHQLGVGR